MNTGDPIEPSVTSGVDKALEHVHQAEHDLESAINKEVAAEAELKVAELELREAEQKARLEIYVNRKVVVPPHEVETGHAIKALAISQGVPNVEIGFDLFLIVGQDTQVRIVDEEEVKLQNGMNFRMIRPDHSS